MIGTPVRERRLHEPAPAEALQLVALAERLADALETLGPDADQFAGAQQPLGVGVAGQRRPGLAGQRARARRAEDQVGAEHAQVPVRRVLVVHGDRGHGRVQGPQPAGVIRDEQRAALGRDVVDAVDLDPEPAVVERPRAAGSDDVLGEVGVEAELVDLRSRRASRRRRKARASGDGAAPTARRDDRRAVGRARPRGLARRQLVDGRRRRHRAGTGRPAAARRRGGARRGDVARAVQRDDPGFVHVDVHRSPVAAGRRAGLRIAACLRARGPAQSTPSRTARDGVRRAASEGRQRGSRWCTAGGSRTRSRSRVVSTTRPKLQQAAPARRTPRRRRCCATSVADAGPAPGRAPGARSRPARRTAWASGHDPSPATLTTPGRDVDGRQAQHLDGVGLVQQLQARVEAERRSGRPASTGSG